MGKKQLKVSFREGGWGDKLPSGAEATRLVTFFGESERSRISLTRNARPTGSIALESPSTRLSIDLQFNWDPFLKFANLQIIEERVRFTLLRTNGLCVAVGVTKCGRAASIDGLFRKGN